MPAPTFTPHSQEEQELMESLENEEWQSAPNLEARRQELIEIARQPAVLLDDPLELPLTPDDQFQLRKAAHEQGIDEEADPPPTRLQIAETIRAIQEESVRKGTDRITPEEIEAEIQAVRRERRS